MMNFIQQHQFSAAVAIYWIFSAAVSAMPEPGTNASSGYLWLYRFMHTTAGNITTVFKDRIPGLKSLFPLLLLPFVLSTTACAAHYKVHPGALNVSDSAAYDVLLTAEAAIDQARLDNQAQPLPAGAKDALNTLVQSYNIARDSWLAYRAAIAAKTASDPYLQQLNKNLIVLANAIRELATNRKEVN